MCTAATYTTDSFYFGRNLDYEFSYGDEVTVTPRAYQFALRCMGNFRTKYAMIGMAYVAGEYPLYYDAVNEKGLGIAGLNFVGNAVYHPAQDGKSNVAQFELIPWLLGSCATLAEVRTLLAKTNIVNIPFSEQLPLAQLHWLIADKTGSIVVESTADGLHIYDNPVGVLTNNPPFPQQLFSLNNYMNLSPKQPQNTFSADLPLTTYSRGMGALGLPGDLSSASRFVRAAFTRLHSVSGEGEADSVGQFFHILGAVEQQNGCCEVRPGEYERTIYTSCWNADRGIYYYTTYTNGKETYLGRHQLLDADTWDDVPLAAVTLLPEDTFRSYERGARGAWFLGAVLFLMMMLAAATMLSRSFVKPINKSLAAVRGGATEMVASGIPEIDELLAAIRERPAGTLPPEVEARLQGFARRAETLTGTERTILQYYMDGHTVKDIPELASISASTVKTHNRNLYRKLGVASFDELKVYIELFAGCGRSSELLSR